ncbi:MAG: lipocalin family protein [Bacteroides sp.]|nr:lipocalin family protein [Eubacterium sp.]MCM1417393.1 lipocalin family protein [Roseburia sp.]MCM1461414.1 lipocalin family protein [Bacteroides sp.]
MRDFFKEGLLPLALCVSLAACSAGETNDPGALAGTWVRTETDMTITYTLNADGTFEQHTETTAGIAVAMDSAGTFTYDGSEIVLTHEDFGTETTYTVELDGSTMYWDTGSKVLEYKKK